MQISVGSPYLLFIDQYTYNYVLFFCYLYSAKITGLTMQQSKNRMSCRVMKKPGPIMINIINDNSTVPSFNRLGEIISITGRQTDTSNDKANRTNRACSSSLRGMLLLTGCGWIILRFLNFDVYCHTLTFEKGVISRHIRIV